MGSETYCFICSGPLHSHGNIGNIKSIKKCLKFLKSKLKKKDYDGLLYYSDSFDEFINQLEKTKLLTDRYVTALRESKISLNQPKYNWLNKLIFIHKSNKNINNVKAFDSWDRDFVDKKDGHYIASFNYNDFFDYIAHAKLTQSGVNRHKRMYNRNSKHFFGGGYVCHKDCYKVVIKKYGEFTFDDMYLGKVNYGVIEKYNLQEVPWLLYFINGDEYVLESPLKNSNNKSRILQIKHSIKTPS